MSKETIVFDPPLQIDHEGNIVTVSQVVGSWEMRGSEFVFRADYPDVYALIRDAMPDVFQSVKTEDVQAEFTALMEKVRSKPNKPEDK